MPIRCRLYLSSLAIFLVAGCGAKEPYPVPVSGQVLLDGKPLPEGTIQFHTPGKVPEILEIKDGRFDGKATWGERRVELAAYRPYRIPPEAPESLRPLMAGGKENYLPEIYHRKSTLKADVKEAGPNEFTFELRSDAR